MIKITNQNDFCKITDTSLRAYLMGKANKMMEDYNINSLDDIGCFLVLDKTEFQNFRTDSMEFIEVLNIGDFLYLHGVIISGDSYGEDIYLPVEVTLC